MSYIKTIQGIEFQWEEDYAWEGVATLPSLSGFRYGYFSSPVGLSDGSVCVTIEPSDMHENIEPSEVQMQAIEWLLENESTISNTILLRIYQEYPSLQKIFKAFLEEEFEQKMPDLSAKEDLKKLIGITNLIVHDQVKGDLPYIGFSLNCTWDDEHALGLMMHGNRVVKFGGAETALLEWIAVKDSESN